VRLGCGLPRPTNVSVRLLRKADRPASTTAGATHLFSTLGGVAQLYAFYLSSQTSSKRQPLYMLLVIVVSPFTSGRQQVALVS
jgi:hypothetical protein